MVSCLIIRVANNGTLEGPFFMGHLENVEPLGLMVMVALVYCTVTSLSIENLSRTPINGPICDNRCLLVRPSF